MAGSCAWLLVLAREGRLKRRKEGSADFGLVLSTFILFGRLKTFNNFQTLNFSLTLKTLKIRKFCLVRKRLYKYLSVTPGTTLVSVDKFDCLSRDVEKVGKGAWWWSGFSKINSACSKYMFYFYKFDFESWLLLKIFIVKGTLIVDTYIHGA